MVVAPFSKLAPILMLHIAGAWCLLVHWAANNDICFLTLLEGQLRGVHYKKSFLHQFIAPVYNISDKRISDICHGVVVATMFISFYNLLESDTFSKAKKCYAKDGSVIDCFKIMFAK